jgi:hypothetical protein
VFLVVRAPSRIPPMALFFPLFSLKACESCPFSSWS